MTPVNNKRINIFPDNELVFKKHKNTIDEIITNISQEILSINPQYSDDLEKYVLNLKKFNILEEKNFHILKNSNLEPLLDSANLLADLNLLTQAEIDYLSTLSDAHHLAEIIYILVDYNLLTNENYIEIKRQKDLNLLKTLLKSLKINETLFQFYFQLACKSTKKIDDLLRFICTLNLPAIYYLIEIIKIQKNKPEHSIIHTIISKKQELSIKHLYFELQSGYIRNTGNKSIIQNLEGGCFEKNLNKLIENLIFYKNKAEKTEENFITNIIDIVNRSHFYYSKNPNIKTAHFLINQIQLIPPNHPILFFIKCENHGLIIKLNKNEKSQFTIKIYNSGSGLHMHKYIKTKDDFYKFENLMIKEIDQAHLNERFFEALKNQTTIQGLYSFLNQLGPFISDGNASYDQDIVGSCSYQSIIRWIKDEVPKSFYIKFKRNSVERFVADVETFITDQSPSEYQKLLRYARDWLIENPIKDSKVS